MTDLQLNTSSLDRLGSHAYGSPSVLERMLDHSFVGKLLGAGTTAFGGVGGIDLDGLTGGDPFQQQLAMIRIQQQVQAQQQQVNLLSNILKSDHDARMAAIRNIKP
jgi:hypothetical protein